MGWFDGFPFQSREQMDKEKRDFEKRVFPFGLAQRDCARAVLQQLVPNKKFEGEALFAFISSKDIYMQNEQSPEGLQHARKQLKRMRFFSEEDKDKILALVVLDAAAPSLEEYPTAEAVLARVAQPDE